MVSTTSSFTYELSSNGQHRRQLHHKLLTMKHFGRIVLATILTLPAVLGIKSQLNGWYPCSELTFSDEGSADGLAAECATYNAPLCYPRICDSSDASESTVDIFVKRMLATVGDSATSTNVWVLQGGPGDSSTGMESSMGNLYNQLGGAINVYTMDHRGTGRSTFLDCVAAQDTTIRDLSKLPACSQDLHYKYGDLASFSMTSAATDIATFISNFTNGASTIVYGVSYGTALVERLIHLNPPTVTGYVLDSISSGSGAPADKFMYFSMTDANFGQVGDAFLELCDRDKACSSHFEPEGLAATLQSLILQLDNAPESSCAKLLSNGTAAFDPPSLILRRTLASMLQQTVVRKLIPPVVYRLNRCSPADVAVLSHFMEKLDEDLNEPNQRSEFFSMPLYYLIKFSEFWESPTPSTETMRARFTNASISRGASYPDLPLYCAFSKENSTVCNQLNVGNYSGDGIVYTRDQYWNKSAVIPDHASVLLLNGRLDPFTPPKYAEGLLAALDGDKKELITFDHAVHATVVSSNLVEDLVNATDTCGFKLLASFVENRGDLERLDRSCVSEMPAFNMTTHAKFRHDYLGTEDAYDGPDLHGLMSSR